MYVIRPATRYAWKQRLTGDHGLDEDTAQTVVDYVVAESEVTDEIPTTSRELEDALMAVEDTLDELNLEELGDVETHQTVRADLVDILERSLTPDGETTGSTAARGRSSLVVASEANEPPAHLEGYIDTFAELIEDDEEPFEFEDLVAIVDWVEFRTQE